MPNKLSLRIVLFAAILSSFTTFFGAFASPAYAAQPAGSSYMRCDRMKENTAPGSCLIVFTTSSATNTETSFRLTLDTEWVSTTNFSTTFGNYTVSTAGLPAGVTPMPGINTATAVSSQTITFPITALATSTQYGFFITGSGLILNPAASTTIVHTLFTHDGAVADTKDVAVPTITDDQIVITATVPPSFTFTIGSNTAALGTLSTSSIISGSGNSVTILSNAPNGWLAWVKSANVALTSVNSGGSILTAGVLDATPQTLSAGTAGYVLDVNLTTDAGGGGTVTIDPEYNGTTTSEGGTLSTTYQAIATSNGTANNDVITLVPRVAIGVTTPAAADYTDTLTVVGAGIF